MSNRKSPSSMTVQVVFDTGDLTPADRREAIDRAERWAWYEALHAKDQHTRAHWRAFGNQLTGVTIALALG
jgi:hypothetical protein